MSSQQLDIIAYLKRHHSIDTLRAMQLGICRLSERIRELEARGYGFNREAVNITNRHGHYSSFVAYSLVHYPNRELVK